jgi:acetyl esterase/lipase
MIDNAEELGIDPNRLAIGGASAGGGLAAGLALKNRAEANHPLCSQLLLYPMIDNLHNTESGQITNHPIWTRASSFNAWEMYFNGEPGSDASPYAAASRADDLAGLPPAYICVGVEDLFRDEDIDYAKRLMAAAVPCELAIFPGVFHAAEVFLPDTVISRRMNRSISRALFDALA